MQNPAARTMQLAESAPDEEKQRIKCPRCDSTNTKFCYYNNYNLSQPRHFCKDCRRYWTKGGALRKVPIGGATRKNSKRSYEPPSATSDSNPKRLSVSDSPDPSSARFQFPIPDPISVLYSVYQDEGWSFSSLLDCSNSSSGSENPTPQHENSLSLQGDSSYWPNGWPDLNVYASGSSFQ